MSVRADLRHAFRALMRAPWYTSTVVCVTALGIVIMTTVFAVVDGVLFRPLPYIDPHEIFAMNGTFEDAPEVRGGFVGMTSPREVHALRQGVPGTPMTLVGYSSIALENGGFAFAAMVDRDFFGVFGVRLLAGGFADTDFAAEQPVMPVVISHRLWTTEFNRDPSIVGRIVRPVGFRTSPYRIAGVLDENGFVPPLMQEGDGWIRRPSRIDALVPASFGSEFGERIGTAFLRAPRERARAIASALGSAAVAYRATVPPPRRPYTSVAQRHAMAPYDGVRLVPVGDIVTARQRPVLAIVFATAVALTLLVLLNAASLAAARAQQRLPEVVLRRSLGARPRDLMRGALIEQGILTAGGAALGLALSPALLRLVERVLPPGLELIKAVRLDWRAAALVVLVSMIMALAVAIARVRFVLRHAALNALVLRAGSRGGAAGRVLVATQIALAFVLVLGGALFVRSMGLVWAEDPGMRMHDAALLDVSFGDLMNPARQRHLVDGVRAVPGVAAAGAFDLSILENVDGSSSTFRGPDGAPAPEPQPRLMRVGSGFLVAAGIQLVAGRLPSSAEVDTGAPVIVISQALAERYWPGQSAVGRSLRSSARAESQVIGVVRDARLVALDVAPAGTIFAPFARPTAGMRIFVAFSGPSKASLARVIARVPELEPLARVSEARMVEEAAEESVRPRTLSAIAASGFAIGSLVVIAIALFGLAAQTTGWRAREMGIRLALGETPLGIVRLVATQHLITTVAGLAAGALTAAAAVRVIASSLYGITAYDAAMWASAAAVVVAAAIAGMLVPALRAAAISPVEALRAE